MAQKLYCRTKNPKLFSLRPNRDELYYFPTFDLLIKVIYAEEANSLRYATHRSTTLPERKVIDKYVLQEIAPKTDYYKRTPSLLLYMGVDATLKKELKAYQVKDTIKSIIENKHEIEKKVQALISSSLSNYYFERLGDKLLSLRKILELELQPDELENLLTEISILLHAYNQNSGQQIGIEEILPHEAVKHFQALSNS